MASAFVVTKSVARMRFDVQTPVGCLTANACNLLYGIIHLQRVEAAFICRILYIIYIVQYITHPPSLYGRLCDLFPSKNSKLND